MWRGIQINEENDLLIKNGRLVVGETKMQDAYIVLASHKGEIKNDPLMGANLIPMIRSGENKERIRKAVTIALERVGLKYEEIKQEIELIINSQKYE